MEESFHCKEKRVSVGREEEARCERKKQDARDEGINDEREEGLRINLLSVEIRIRIFALDEDGPLETDTSE